MFADLIVLDSKSMIGILVWCNLALCMLVMGYRFTRTEIIEKRLIGIFAFSKLFEGLAWFLLFERAHLPLLWSRFVGNNLLFLGFFLESIVMLGMAKKFKLPSVLLQIFILLASVVVFDSLQSGTENYVYVIVASLITFCIFLYPTILYMVSKEGSSFKRFLGLGYVFFLGINIARALLSYLDVDMHLFTVNYIQHFAFITLILLTVVSGPGFLLLLKEEADYELRILASLDGLTRIANRRHFMIEAQKLFEQHQKVQQAMSVLFIDIDHFKLVNDEYGHGFGDEVLVHLAQVLKNTVRGEDLVCRYGGEEFVVLLHNTDKEGAKVVIEHIRQHIGQARLSIADFSYSISIGLYATIPPEGTLYDFIKKSDDAMYLAKQQGRNRYVIYEE